MAETYTLHVAGLTRELTICKVNDHMDIAAFIMLGDAELTVVRFSHDPHQYNGSDHNR